VIAKVADYAFGSIRPTGYPKRGAGYPKRGAGDAGRSTRPFGAHVGCCAWGACSHNICLPSEQQNHLRFDKRYCLSSPIQDSTMKTVLFGLFAAFIFCTTAVASEPGTPTATPRDWATQPTAPQAGPASDNTGRERAQDGTTALPTQPSAQTEQPKDSPKDKQ
jgi:hypothetical protein